MGGSVENSMNASLVPDVPKVSMEISCESLGSNVYSSLLVVTGFGFSTSISVSLVARSPAPVAVTFIVWKDEAGLTLKSKLTICSPTALKVMFFEVPLMASNAFPASILTVTFLTLGSMAKTVTGMVTVSPGDNFLGMEVNTIKGLRTGTVFSAFP